MNVLSLFDGMSCGQLAMKRCGIKVNKYYSSEIDQHAIAITRRNFPKTIQYGDVRFINKNHFFSKIDLIIAGSPCQGFSFAGKRLNFEDPRSKLFFEFVRLKNELNVKYFFLENVRMDKQSENIISNILEVEPIKFNSMLVSAQSRNRLYWTNIPIDFNPVDREMCVNDIMEPISGRKHKLYENIRKYDECSFNRCIKVGLDITTKFEQGQRVYSMNAKAPTLDTKSGGNRGTKIAISEAEYIDLSVLECERLQGLPDGYTNNVSKHASLHAIGNGWQVDTICEFFKFL